MATATATIPDFYMQSYWINENGSFKVQSSTGIAEKSVVVSIPENSAITGAVLTITKSNPLVMDAVFKINDVSYAYQYGDLTVPLNITGNGTSYTINFAFQSAGNVSLSDGQHIDTISLTDGVVTVTYEASTEPEPTPEIELETSELFCLFEPNEKKFAGNGICVLTPSVCTVSEIAGGMYELHMEHPMDKYGKWELLETEYIISAPVPPLHIPEITLPAVSVWRVKSSVTSTPLYTRLPSYTKAKTEVDEIEQNPSMFLWNSATNYPASYYVVYDDWIYVSNFANVNKRPGTGREWASTGKKVSNGGSGGGSSGPSGGTYDPGVIAETLLSEELVTKLADFNSTYMQVRSLRGVSGYVRRSDCELTDNAAYGQTIPAHDIRTQRFRIYEVRCEDDTHTVNVSARHISYDYQNNSLFDCQLIEATPATAIAILQGSLIDADNRLIACDIADGQVSCDWSFQNPIYALLDPDDGLLNIIKGRLIRDNNDFYILDNSQPNKGPKIMYGTNMLGVQWSRNTEGVITRIVPRCGDGKEGYVYLDELYIDSPIVGEYHMPRIEILDCDCYVGQKVEHADGTVQMLTREDCVQIMREKAEKRFTVDKADALVVSLDVQFVLLGDTVEFAQYKGLQNLCLYDEITVDTGMSGVNISAQMTGYEWDCIGRHYNEITVGNMFSAIKHRIPGFRMNNRTITYAKLAPGLISKIKGVTVS